ncbi:hypothetical protein [Enterobacter phage vB_EclM_AS6]
MDHKLNNSKTFRDLREEVHKYNHLRKTNLSRPLWRIRAV